MRFHQEYSHTHQRCPACLEMVNSCIPVVYVSFFFLNFVLHEDIRRLAVKWRECHIPSAETKLIITNKPVSWFFFVFIFPDESAKWDEGAWLLMCHTLISNNLQMPWRWPYLWLIFLTSFFFFAGSSRSDLWILMFSPLVMPHRSSLAVGSFAQFTTTSLTLEGVCRRNWQSDTTWTQKCWMWRYLFTFYMSYCDAAPQTTSDWGKLRAPYWNILSPPPPPYFTNACFGMLVCRSLTLMWCIFFFPFRNVLLSYIPLSQS